MRVSVDQDKCRGAGQCRLLAPEVFDQRDQDGIVILVAGAAPPPGQHEAVRDAANVCPTSSISVLDDDA
jgi:ferredoxin